MRPNTATLRSKRQLTLPKEVCDELGLSPGDRLVLDVRNGVLVARPGREVARDALRAMQKALQEAGVTEEELIENGRRLRDDLFRERYPDLAKKYGI